MKLEVVDRNKDIVSYDLPTLATLYQTLLSEMKIDGVCGGACSCATCHIYVDATLQEALPPPSTEEEDTLSGLLHRTSNSRLLCQLSLDCAPEILRIELAPEE